MGRDETPVSWFHTRATHYVEAQMLFHLSQAGVMAELYRGPATAEDIAERLQLDTAVLRTLLDYVVGVDDLLRQNDEGQYVLTDFGHQVFKRFAKDEAMDAFNFFDVRVGCFGPVWQNLGGLVTKEAVYGRDFHRKGEFAAQGVSKLSRHLIRPIDAAVAATGATRLVIVGLTPGLVRVVAQHHPKLTLFGLDRDQSEIDKVAAGLADEVAWQPVCADFFKPQDWAQRVVGPESDGTGLIVSVHFHEFLAGGIDPLKQLMGALKEHVPGWHVLALEQDRLPESARADTPETLWLYSHSNILIHHLIGNAKILSREQWLDALGSGGAEVKDIINARYLGYNGYLVGL